MPTPSSSRASVFASAVLTSTGPAMAIGASSVAATRAALSPLINMASLPVCLARGDHRRARGGRLIAGCRIRRRRIRRVRGDSGLLRAVLQAGDDVEAQERPLAVPGLASGALPEMIDAREAAVPAAIARRARGEAAQHGGDVGDG